MIGSAALLLALLLPQEVPRSAGYVIFAAERAQELLRQCSRSVPASGESGWMPSDSDIARLEKKLPAALDLMRSDPYGRRMLQGAPKGWARQYVGIVRGDKRFIYGNFAPSDIARDPRYA